MSAPSGAALCCLQLDTLNFRCRVAPARVLLADCTVEDNSGGKHKLSSTFLNPVFPFQICLAVSVLFGLAGLLVQCSFACFFAAMKEHMRCCGFPSEGALL